MTTIPYLLHLTKASLKKRLLIHFFTHPQERLYLREIALKIGVDPANLSRELAYLEKEKVFLSEKRGLQKFFFLNQDYPLYQELCSIIHKTLPQAKDISAASTSHLSKQTRVSPQIYVIAGPNGAGKTTFAKKFLPDYVWCKQFVNADLIAGGLAPFSPEQAALQAGKLLLEQIDHLSSKRISFGFETTLAGVTYLKRLAELKKMGYQIRLFFLWIPSLELALARIEDRVKRGGHFIPEETVRRRFQKGIDHLFKLYRPLLDSWMLFDNSGTYPHLIAAEENRKLKIIDAELFDKIQKGVER